MRGFARIVCAALLFVSCHRGGPSAPPFDANAFIAATADVARSDVNLGDEAARRARLPETKQLGAAVAAEQRALLADLATVAQRRKVALPAALEDRRAALQQNLAILQGRVYDRAWALALVQDYDALLSSLGAASQSDEDLRAFAARVRPTVAARRKAVGALLNELGGSPFNVAP
jgi:putative membrane protein